MTVNTDPKFLAGQVERLALAKVERHIFLCADQSKPNCSDLPQSPPIDRAATSST